MSIKKTILLLPRHPTSWRKLFEIALLMKGSPGLRPVVVLANEATIKHADECRQHGIDYLSLHAQIEQQVRDRSPVLLSMLQRLDRWLARYDRLANSLLVSLLRIVEMRRRLKIEYAIFRGVCEREQPTAILVPGDRELTPVPAMLRAGLDLNVPNIIVATGHPYTQGVAFFRKPYARFRVNLTDWPPLLNFYVARRYPGQVHETEYGRLLFSPGWIVCALASLRMLSGNPWVQGGGNSNYVLMNDRRRLGAFVELGVPEHKLVLLGDHLLDPLFHTWQNRSKLRADFRAAHALRSSAKIVFFSVPNDAEHNVCSWEDHLGRMEGYFQALGNCGADVFLSLHPKSLPESYLPLAERYGLRILDARLTDVLPAADVFICSGSSTIQWAQLCEVPAINLDYFGLKDIEYENAPGIANVTSAEEFSIVLKQLVEKAPFTDEGFADHSLKLRTGCCFDGKSGQRICDFLASDMPQYAAILAQKPHLS